MRLTIESTETVVVMNGTPCRQWDGQTEGGVPVTVFIGRVSVAYEHVAAFEQEQATAPLVHSGDGLTPSGPQIPPLTDAIDMRLLL